MRWYGKFYLIAMLVVLYLPIFFLMLYSFNSAGNMVQFEGLLGNIIKHYSTTNVYFKLCLTRLRWRY